MKNIWNAVKVEVHAGFWLALSVITCGALVSGASGYWQFCLPLGIVAIAMLTCLIGEVYGRHCIYINAIRSDPERRKAWYGEDLPHQ